MKLAPGAFVHDAWINVFKLLRLNGVRPQDRIAYVGKNTRNSRDFSLKKILLRHDFLAFPWADVCGNDAP